MKGYTEVVQALLEAGADVDDEVCACYLRLDHVLCISSRALFAPVQAGIMAAHAAVTSGHVSALKLILDDPRYNPNAIIQVCLYFTCTRTCMFW